MHHFSFYKRKSCFCCFSLFSIILNWVCWGVVDTTWHLMSPKWLWCPFIFPPLGQVVMGDRAPQCTALILMDAALRSWCHRSVRLNLKIPQKKRNMHTHTCPHCGTHVRTHPLTEGIDSQNSTADSRLRKETERKKNKKDGGGRALMTLMSRYILGVGIEAAGSYL